MIIFPNYKDQNSFLQETVGDIRDGCYKSWSHISFLQWTHLLVNISVYNHDKKNRFLQLGQIERITEKFINIPTTKDTITIARDIFLLTKNPDIKLSTAPRGINEIPKFFIFTKFLITGAYNISNDSSPVGRISAT